MSRNSWTRLAALPALGRAARVAWRGVGAGALGRARRLGERARGVAPRLMRVLAVMAAAQALLVALVARTALASADAALDAVLSSLSELPGSLGFDSPRELRLNGAELRLAVGRVERPVTEVLDALQRRCGQRGAPVRAWLQGARAGAARPGARGALGALQALTAGSKPLLDGALRVDGAQRGSVACLETEPAAASLGAWIERARAFATTGDVARLGRLHYYLVESLEGSGGAASRVVALWAPGQLVVTRLFAATGDAPGRDLAGVPRPAGSRRLLSAEQDGASARLVAHRVQRGSPETVRASYAQSLAAAGWKVAAAGAAEPLLSRAGASTPVAFTAAAPTPMAPTPAAFTPVASTSGALGSSGASESPWERPSVLVATRAARTVLVTVLSEADGVVVSGLDLGAAPEAGVRLDIGGDAAIR